MQTPAVDRPTLARAIGRWGYTAAIINSVIGSSVFAMPAVLARLVGEWSPLAVIVAGLAVGVVVLCFAEVGSRFDRTGGPYLSTREAFGAGPAFLVGWLHIWVVGLATIAATYALVQVVVCGTVPHVGGIDTPVARALDALVPHGGLIGSVGAILSTYGWLTGFALMTPRVLFSMAERAEPPAAPAPSFVLPGGPALAVVGVAFCGWMLATRTASQLAMLAILIAGAVLRSAARWSGSTKS